MHRSIRATSFVLERFFFETRQEVGGLPPTRGGSACRRAPFMAAFTMENQARMRVTITSDRIETSGNNRPVATAGRQLRRCARIPAPA